MPATLYNHHVSTPISPDKRADRFPKPKAIDIDFEICHIYE